MEISQPSRKGAPLASRGCDGLQLKAFAERDSVDLDWTLACCAASAVPSGLGRLVTAASSA